MVNMIATIIDGRSNLRWMKSCNCVEDRSATSIQVYGLCTGNNGDLATPAEAIHVELLHTVISKDFGEVKDTRKYGVKAGLGLEETSQFLFL